jgi:hypothetical protein
MSRIIACSLVVLLAIAAPLQLFAQSQGAAGAGAAGSAGGGAGAAASEIAFPGAPILSQSLPDIGKSPFLSCVTEYQYC